eukprot:CAMPEP_0118674620 /NCGR_PEP_ID=MMETSP0800-20121206/990_1 /TAXON_ID=210618 ORGANISM="Striatella unipunctata, Strain CCMP2910" /NCGR_SAMPLE_ID=MMETSP0800 /ASSEMBLY_ACC=CAM_ASM_000638 /LENGTH=988 /DNA_ID=CAMNT_0006569837 /DNA_START=48 /DNA_END=3014 /DNA_ORIENTATION=-
MSVVPGDASKNARFLWNALYVVGLANALGYIVVNEAYKIRLHAIEEYGIIIHEFDPYFNFRATEYLWEHGWRKFATWFDYLVWYPLGRPVGTTIYPGMQVTACFIKKYIMTSWSLNDVCCFVPAWFGGIATVLTALLAYECTVETLQPNGKGDEVPSFTSILKHIPGVNLLYDHVIVPIINFICDSLEKYIGIHTLWGLRPRHDTSANLPKMHSPSLECGLFAAAIMSIVPAHLMRSVGGGFDNESVATTAMVLTYWLWVRSLRVSPAWLWGILTGIGYFYMVASWGGYIFCVNLIGVHAAVLAWGLGRFTPKLYQAYTCFYVVGTALAIQVPVVGWTPLKSLEQLGPLGVFIGFQLMQVCMIIKKSQEKKLGRPLSMKERWTIRVAVFGSVGVAVAIAGYFLASTGYFGPISARVRGLFVKHTKTGNPLVDSVAEHQPASNKAYFQYLHDVCYVSPVGFALVALFYFSDASSFLLVYGGATFFFSNKMVRLVLLTAPIGSVLAGIALGHAWSWCYSALLNVFGGAWEIVSPPKKEPKNEDTTEKTKGKKTKAKGGAKASKDTKDTKAEGSFKSGMIKIVINIARLAVGAYLIHLGIPRAKSFYDTCHMMATHISNPSIVLKGTDNSGRTVYVDDYREAYWWLRDNTPEDARIMAWWDYGYQITAIANRTTIADGNTWNHEHIALLGRALTSPEKDGHRIARHLADYVLLWTGGGGDDLAKSPHMARIANSVYRFMCPGDPTCRNFGFVARGTPTPRMGGSLLYKLHSHRTTPGVEADKNRFREVYSSKHGKCRIFKILSVSQESKDWVKNPKNRDCDVKGGWFCRGQYPPALRKVLEQKQDFAQLEDFNTNRDDSEYQKQYFEHLNDPNKAANRAMQSGIGSGDGEKKRLPRLPKEQIAKLNDNWHDSDTLTAMWEFISKNDAPGVISMLRTNPEAAHLRSADGRGPMWWAHEFGRAKIIKILKSVGVSETEMDDDGMRPVDLSKSR